MYLYNTSPLSCRGVCKAPASTLQSQPVCLQFYCNFTVVKSLYRTLQLLFSTLQLEPARGLKASGHDIMPRCGQLGYWACAAQCPRPTLPPPLPPSLVAAQRSATQDGMPLVPQPPPSPLGQASVPPKHQCSPSSPCTIRLSEIGKCYHAFPRGTFRSRFAPPTVPRSVLNHIDAHPSSGPGPQRLALTLASHLLFPLF